MRNIIDGKKVSTKILGNLKEQIAQEKNKIGLAFVLVGDNFASKTYLKMKKKACSHIGITPLDFFLEEKTTTQELIQLIKKLNSNDDVHGIIVQQPLPKHIDTSKIVETIAIDKDVDGFHPQNLGKMILGEEDGFYSCTPYGIMLLLQDYQINLEGKHVVILGRSNIVGKPLYSLLIQNKPMCNATVTNVHSRTKDITKYTKSADVIISAIGKPHFLKKDMVKENAIIIDVGINRLNNSIVGDVDFDDVKEKVSLITPVPGGVGPMTIATLMLNTYKAFKKIK